ncbi:tRNA (adenosine(37)-N6)-dimethylallyltransferase MiaA [Schaalia sp. lx-100]|uniref:tRNA (adenosine(37)-N6)-dimethylallyltransferase MiaA n=1 Tax=Schaalia sp. lx-100 TaxID=2899081 RepID=UPI003FA79E40
MGGYELPEISGDLSVPARVEGEGAQSMGEGPSSTRELSSSAALPRLAEPWKLIVAVVGATASGKSDLALDLAEKLPEYLEAPGNAELISADSMQFYRGMDIGTAKTPLEDRRGIPHYHIDTLDITQEASAALYQQQARADVRQIHSRGNMVIVAGGSGLYQRALLDVIDFPGTDPAIRRRLEAEAQRLADTHELHRRLAENDPVAARHIDPNNTRRIIRALEVIELTGKPYSATMPQRVYYQPTVMLGIQRPLEELDTRIAVRTQKMFDEGLVEEVRSLIPLGLREGKTASKATGYAQALAYIDGHISLDEARDSVALATRQLARRQLKWLRPDHRVIWLPPAAPEQLLEQAVQAVTYHLACC